MAYILKKKTQNQPEWKAKNYTEWMGSHLLDVDIALPSSEWQSNVHIQNFAAPKQEFFATVFQNTKILVVSNNNINFPFRDETFHAVTLAFSDPELHQTKLQHINSEAVSRFLNNITRIFFLEYTKPEFIINETFTNIEDEHFLNYVNYLTSQDEDYESDLQDAEEDNELENYLYNILAEVKGITVSTKTSFLDLVEFLRLYPSSLETCVTVNNFRIRYYFSVIAESNKLRIL